jgi:uncharacterized circularly permuted ATP-grasp superfamily protein
VQSRFQNYWLDGAFDEMFEAEGHPRPHYEALYELLLNLPGLHQYPIEAALEA